jgi:hypothetical protein
MNHGVRMVVDAILKIQESLSITINTTGKTTGLLAVEAYFVTSIVYQDSDRAICIKVKFLVKFSHVSRFVLRFSRIEADSLCDWV